MKQNTLFPMERENAMQVFTFPEEGRVVEENPPCLCWIPPAGEHTYTVNLMRDGHEIYRAETKYNYHVPKLFLEEGAEYTWNVFSKGCERGELAFTVAHNAVRIERIDAQTLYEQIPTVHPRHLFFASDIEELKRTRKEEVAVLRRNIEEAYADGIPQMPMYHRDPKALPYREFFGRFRDFCDRNLVACALGYALLGDERAGAFAKELLLTMCDRNPAGPCSLLGPWGDEVGLSLARCLPSVYDLLYPILDERERKYVAYTVRAYGEQCYIRLKARDYCQNPGDSHVGRLPAYLGEAAMVLKDSGVQTKEEALLWLDYAQEIYGGIFPYYGTPDGGWAEGVFYSTSYTKWYLPFFNAVERYGGTRFIERPFYRKLSHFFLHFASPEYENHPFGDGYWCHPDDTEWPGFFAQSPLRYYAERFGPSLALQRAKEACAPKLFKLHLLDVFLPFPKNDFCNEEAKNLACFFDAGFVSMHTNLAHTETDLAVIARASKFGSDSHRHADQGSFAIFLGGKAMISPSGYFGRGWGTRHHMEWLKTTRAHNTVLVDGIGQKTNSMESRARIVSVTEEPDFKEAVLDLSTAYPMLSSFVRTIRLYRDRVCVTDEIDSENEVEITYPLHALSMPRVIGNDLLIEHKGRALCVHPKEGGLVLSRVTDQFDIDLNAGVPEAFSVEMPKQYHAYYKTEKRKTHRLCVCYDVK